MSVELRLTQEALVRPDEPVVVEGIRALRAFLGLGSAG